MMKTYLSLRRAHVMLAALGAEVMFSPLAVRAADVPVGHHCAANEVVVFNSRMGTLDWNDAGTRKIFKGNKFLSLCADQFPGMKRLELRYGKIGAVELTHSAADSPYMLQTQMIDKTNNWVALSFRKGAYGFAVIEPQGESATDVFFVMFKDGKPIARTDAIDETGQWLVYKKKAGKKKFNMLSVNMNDMPVALAPRSTVGIDVEAVKKAAYRSNFSVPK